MWAWNICSNEVSALAHLFALIVSMILLSSMPCWPLVPSIAHSFIPNLRALRLHPAFLTSRRVCFWIEVTRVRSLPWLMSERQSVPLIRCLQKSYTLKQVTLPSLPHLHYEFPSGLANPASVHVMGSACSHNLTALSTEESGLRFKPEPPRWHWACHLYTPLLYSNFLLQVEFALFMYILIKI